MLTHGQHLLVGPRHEWGTGPSLTDADAGAQDLLDGAAERPGAGAVPHDACNLHHVIQRQVAVVLDVLLLHAGRLCTSALLCGIVDAAAWQAAERIAGLPTRIRVLAPGASQCQSLSMCSGQWLRKVCSFT